MTEIKTESLTEIEELRATLDLYDKAKEFIESFKWCRKTLNCWCDSKYCIYEKIGVFLFEIEPLNEHVDDFIWVIVGDLPSVYLDKSIQNGKEALESYCELMEEWTDNVKKGKSISESYPVMVEPTIKNAELLDKRISFIKRELITKDNK